MINVFTILKLKGYPVKKAADIINSIHAETNISDWQEKQKWEIFNYHRKDNDFYKNLIPDDIKYWEDIPVLNKQDLMGDYKKKLPAGINIKKAYVSKTSGSSGEPMYFVKDKLSHALIWESIFRHYKSIGITKDDYQARFYGIPLNTQGYYAERLKDLLINRYRFVVFDQSEENMLNWLNKFRSKKFTYVYGYTKTLVEFAKFLVVKNIVLKDICPTLKNCIVTSEMCIKPDCELLKKAFGVDVYNEYGASELSVIGFGKLNNWRVSDEILYLEVVDENDNVLPDGVPGRLISTLLFNKGTPLIRYDTGDVASIEHRDGHTFITGLHGRIREQAVLPSGKKISGATFGYIIKEISDKMKIKEFIFIQRSPEKLIFNYVSDREMIAEEKEYSIAILEKYLEKGIKTEFNRVDEIKRNPNGKYKYFINEIPE